MERPENNPEYWRLRAEAARTRADNASDFKTRRHMLNYAAAYEQVAKITERLQLVSNPSKAANDG